MGKLKEFVNKTIFTKIMTASLAIKIAQFANNQPLNALNAGMEDT